MERTVLNERLRCLSRLYKSQNTLLRSSLRSMSASDASSRSRWQEQSGLAHGDTGAGQRSSSRFSLSERASLMAFDHHL